MLTKFLRKKKNVKRIMWVLAFLIVPSFILWGTGSALRSKNSPKYAGSIFDKGVTFEDFEDSWRACKNQAITVYGNQFNQKVNYADLDEQAWDRLILLGEAKRRKITASDKDIITEIENYPFFQKDGKFDQRTYNLILEHIFRTPPRQFEEEIRKSIIISKLLNTVFNQITVPEEEIKNEYKKDRERAAVSYILIQPKDFENQVKITPDETKNYYDAHSQNFTHPAQVNVKYIALEYANMGNTAPITEEEIKDYYELHFKNSGKNLEEVRGDIEKKLALEENKKLADKEMLKVLDEAVDNSNLESAAKKNSLEIKETGYFSKEEQIPGIGWSYQFANTAFDLKAGQISNVIKDLTRCYIMRLKDKKEPYIPSFEEAKSEIETAVVREKAEKLAGENAETYILKIRELMTKNGLQFEDAAKNLSLEIKKAELLRENEYIPGIGKSGEFSKSAFNLKKGEISNLVKSDKGYCILTLDKIEAPSEDEFLKEKDTFKEKLLAQKRIQFYEQWFGKLKEKAHLKNNITELRKEQSTESTE